MDKSLLPIEQLKSQKPWNESSDPIWLSSSISLQRNIEKFKFPNKLDVERKKQIISLVGKELLSAQQLKDPKLLKAEDLSLFDKEYLIEHFIMHCNLHQTGSGEAILIDNTGSVLVLFNLSDHLCFYKLEPNGDLEGAWSQLVKVETALGSGLNYAFSPKFGFLTADFDRCGTALEVTTFLHLPALMHLEKIDSLLEQEADETIWVMGIQGSPTEIIGDLFAIQNNFTIGVTEENIIASVRSLTSKLVSEEKAARKQIQDSKNPQVIDKISRAYGILLYSYQIEAIEALNAISLCKLGVALGWISGISENELNELFFNCRRAHLLSHFPDDRGLNQEAILHKRAEFIHQGLKNAKLLV